MENNYEPQNEKSRGKGCLIAVIITLLVLVGLLLALVALLIGWRGGFETEKPMHETVGDMVNRWVHDVLDDTPVGFVYSYVDADSFVAGPAEIETRNVNRIVIDWVSGSVTVEPYDGDTISVSEPEQQDEADRLRWRQKGDTLTVRFCAPMNVHVSGSKDLVVKIPAELAENLRYLQIDTVSADVRVSGVKAGELQTDTTSGDVYAEGAFGIVDGDTVSGGLELVGTAKQVDLDTTSGDFGVGLSETPDKLSFDSTSGDLTLMLPAKRGFEVEYDTVSGDFKCDFALKGKDDSCYEGTEHGKRAELEFDTVSGDIWIMNARQA